MEIDCNMQKMEDTIKERKNRRQFFILDLINTWVAPEIQLTIISMNKLLNYFEQFINSIIESDKQNCVLILPAIVYCDKFLKKKNNKLMTLDDLAKTLGISVILAMKFYAEFPSFNYDRVGAHLDTSKKQLIELEREFLLTLDFRLFLQEEDILQYKLRELWKVFE